MYFSTKQGMTNNVKILFNVTYCRKMFSDITAEHLVTILRCENMIMGKTSKVVVFGTKKCGKTSILEQVIYGKLGVSYSNKIYYRQAGKI